MCMYCIYAYLGHSKVSKCAHHRYMYMHVHVHCVQDMCTCNSSDSEVPSHPNAEDTPDTSALSYMSQICFLRKFQRTCLMAQQ